MRLLPLVLALSCLGCECAKVPDDVCLVGECGAGRGGGTGGGRTGGGQGGGEGTGGAGGGDVGGGTGGGGDVDAGPSDAGNPLFCETWNCVQALLPPRAVTAPGFALEHVAFPPNLSLTPAGCTLAFAGGVLMPDDSVLLVPACADHFVRVDVERRMAILVGPPLPLNLIPLPDGGSLSAPRYYGGVLDCDGSVVAMPWGGAPLRLRTDGTTAPFPFTAQTVGGVLAGDCNDRRLLMGDVDHRLVDAPSDMTMPNVQSAGAFYSGIMRGCLRRPTSAACVFSGHIPIVNSPVLILYSLGVSDAFGELLRTLPGSNGTQGAAVTRSGGLVLFDVTRGGALTLEDGGSVLRVPATPTDGGGDFSWPASRADGFVYVAEREGLWVMDEASGAEGARLQRFPGYEGLGTPFYGLVGHPSGVLVAVPYEAPDIVLFVPDGGVVVPGRVLRSPFFNKL